MSASQALYLAIDQGGHASRAVVYDATGREAAAGAESIATNRLGTDRVEHDAEALLASVQSHCRRGQRARPGASPSAGRRPRDTAFQHRVLGSETVLRSRTSSPQDRRAAAWLDALRLTAGEYELTGLVLSPHYGARASCAGASMRWSRFAEPRPRAVSCAGRSPFWCFVTNDRVLHADPCNASRTLLWALSTRLV
jgi:glycerol kinase